MPSLFLLSLLLSSLAPVRAGAGLPERLTAREMEAVSALRQRVSLPVETVLLIPDGGAIDPKSRTKFDTVCYAYLLENGIYVRRFAVHAPDREGLAAARNTARFLSLVWWMADRRYGTHCSRLRARPMDVWLTRSGRAGGEQFGTSIYVYDIAADRSGLEWARELAHEYGHYLLPGASGYSDPESWSNGLLGERLFLKWLREELDAGRVLPEMVAFAAPAEIADYCEKQPEPLIDRVRRRGADTAALTRKDAAAMDELTALQLYTDATYGPKALIDLLDFMPPNAAASAKPQDFHTALGRLLASAPSFQTRLAPGKPGRILLPAGKFTVSAEAGLAALAIDRGSARQSATGHWIVNVAQAGWRTLTPQGAGLLALRWEKQ